jgi:hypothetical protein
MSVRGRISVSAISHDELVRPGWKFELTPFTWDSRGTAATAVAKNSRRSAEVDPAAERHAQRSPIASFEVAQFVVLAPKGPDKSAQGNALGTRKTRKTSEKALKGATGRPAMCRPYRTLSKVPQPPPRALPGAVLWPPLWGERNTAQHQKARAAAGIGRSLDAVSGPWFVMLLDGRAVGIPLRVLASRVVRKQITKSDTAPPRRQVGMRLDPGGGLGLYGLGEHPPRRPR